MELSNQIKKYRAELKLSQEDLAEKVYVSRQTISNWETGKNYPDIHSLLLLGSVFNVSLDELIKGDIEIMKEEIKQEEIQKFNSLGTIYAILLLACIILPIPLLKLLGAPALAVYLVLAGVTMYFAFKIEKIKKQHDIQSYKEIVAFTKGERLDEISKHREEGKRPYQKVLLTIGSALITFIVYMLMAKLLGGL